MGYIVLSLIAVVVLFVVLGFSAPRVWRVRPRQLLCFAGFFLILLGCFATVPTGHTGILTTFGRVEDTTLEAGLHIKSPLQQVITMDNRTQKKTLELSCSSSDLQEINVTYSINYQIQKSNAQTIYKTIGTDYYEVVMQPRIEVVVRSMIAQYSAETLIENRDRLSADITAALVAEMDAYNIEVVNTAIENINFSEAFLQAVEDKQVAQQNYLKAQTEQDQKTMEEQQAADRQVISAKAEAEVARIQAEADKEVLEIQADAAEYAGKKDAAVNEALTGSLSDMLLQYYTIKQWNGQLPEYMAGMSEEGILSLIYGLQNQETETLTPAPTATPTPAPEK